VAKLQIFVDKLVALLLAPSSGTSYYPSVSMTQAMEIGVNEFESVVREGVQEISVTLVDKDLRYASIGRSLLPCTRSLLPCTRSLLTLSHIRYA